MKLRFIILAAIIAGLASCSTPEKTGLAALQTKLDSLKKVRTTLEAEILAVEEEIDLLDTTIQNTLVTAYETSQGTFQHFFEVYGNVASDKSVVIYGENGGAIQSIKVKEGQSVKKGQILVSQDVDLINKNIEEIRTQLDLATTLFDKQKRLWDQNIGSELQYLEAKNRKESLENSLATAQEQRSKSTVVAPFSGVIDKVFPKIGELVGMGSPIVRLVNTDELYLNADVSERYLGDVAQGDAVQVILNREDTMYSTISRIGEYINPTNRSFEVRVDLEKSTDVLRPNSLVVVKINDYTKEEAISIPSTLIMQDGNGEDYVFVISKDEHNREMAQKRNIVTTMSYNGQTMVSEGLTKGELIINKGSRSVRDGDLIEVTTI